MKAYPALVDDGRDTVSVRLFDTEAEQAEAMWKGTRRLILRNIPVNPAKFASEKLTNAQKLALSANPHGSVQALFDDCAMAAADRLIADFGGPGLGRGVVPQAVRQGARGDRRHDRADGRRRCSRCWRPGSPVSAD